MKPDTLSPPCPPDLSPDYWNRLSERDRRLHHAIRPMPTSTYTVDIHLSRIESWLEGQHQDLAATDGGVELVPDFQRGHVWTLRQQSAYMESLLRRVAPTEIRFNCPGYTRSWSYAHKSESDRLRPDVMQCVDGLQRLTATRAFMRNEVPVFGGETAASLARTKFDPGRYHLKMSIYEFTSRFDLLAFYLDLNAGGTAHTSAELDRVRALLESGMTWDQPATSTVDTSAGPEVAGDGDDLMDSGPSL